jgi:L1 cell adhesion molecule like protein
LLKNENNLDDMIDILSHIHQYVPVKTRETTDKVTRKKISTEIIHHILLSGDQLTHKRAETAIELRQNGTTPTSQLKGVIPICEDWHAKKCFLEVFVVTKT